MVAPKFRTNLSSSQPQRTKTAAVMSSWCASARTTRRSSEKISRSARMPRSTPSTTRGLAARHASSTCWRSAPFQRAIVRGALDRRLQRRRAIASPSEHAASFVASRRESYLVERHQLAKDHLARLLREGDPLVEDDALPPEAKVGARHVRQQPTKYDGKNVIHSASQMWK